MSDQHAARPETVDAVIIGAGPAGSTAAATLAMAGRSVLVLERRRFPRFHIGESMLPYTMGLLEHLNLLDHAKTQGFPPKLGAEFIFPTGDYRRVVFADQGPGRHAETFQVERSRFDTMLADHARACGAQVIDDAFVQDLVLDGERVTGVRYSAGGRTRTVTAPYVIDAGGRASKIAQAFRLRRPIDRLRMVAVYRHYTGLDERYNPGYEGDIQVGGHPDGWLWAIPIRPDTISVGAVTPKSVMRDRRPEDVFDDHLSRVERITTRLTGTTPMYDDLRVEADYCYYADTLAGPGWFLAGDSGAFIDPIFSAGVCLAMTTAFRAARTVDQILSQPARAEELQSEYQNFYKTGYDTNARLVEAYYESEYNLGRYLRINMGVDVRSDEAGKWFTRLLSGDFWTKENTVAELLRKEERWDTFAPFERAFGCPIYAEADEAASALAAS